MKRLVLGLILTLFMNLWSYSAIEQLNLIENGAKLAGVNTKAVAHFYLEDNRELQSDATLDILVFYSVLTNDNKSSVTFYINERPINSIKLDQEGEKIEKKIVIPKEYLKKGENEITIEKLQLISDNCSLDEVSPSNWLRIEKGILSYEYKDSNKEITLENFPAPFTNKYPSKLPKELNILMGEAPTDGEKLLLANLASFIGAKYKNSEGKIVVDSREKVLGKEEIKENYIIVSEFNRLPIEIQKYYSVKERGLLSDRLSLKIIRGYKGSEKLLLVFAKNGGKFSKDLESLFYLNGEKHLKGDFVIIEDLEFSSKKIGNEKIEKQTLEEIGVSDINISNYGNQKSSFMMTLSKDREIFEDIIFKVQISNSQLVEKNQTILNVRINGRYIAGIDLSRKKDVNEYEIKIPVNMMKEGENLIEFQGDFSQKSKCNIEPEIFITIKKESHFLINSQMKETYKLKDFRAPFVKNRKYDNLAISVSNDKESLSFLGNLFVYMSKIVDSYQEILYLEKIDESKNQIIIGNNENNPLIKEMWNKLFLPYRNPETAIFSGTTDIIVLRNNSYSALEFMKNGKDTYSLYAFTDKEREYENLLNQIKNGNFNGDAYVGVNLDTSIHRKITEESPTIIRRLRGKSSQLSGVFFLIFAMFSVLILYFLNKKK